MGNAYSARVRGKEEENFEKEVEAYQAALTVFTRESTPQQWALIEAALGRALVARVRGDRSDNIEKAIEADERALSVLTRDTVPEQWARIENRPRRGVLESSSW